MNGNHFPTPLHKTLLISKATLLTRIQKYLGGIPDIIHEYCGLHALRTTAHLLKILPTLIVYPLLPVILACIESPHRDTIPHGQFPTSLLHFLLLLQNTLVATFRLYLMSALFIPLSFFTRQRQFTHVLFRILHCIREATLHLFHEIPTYNTTVFIPYPLSPFFALSPNSATLSLPVKPNSYPLISNNTTLLISPQPIPHSSCHSQSSDNLSPPSITDYTTSLIHTLCTIPSSYSFR